MRKTRMLKTRMLGAGLLAALALTIVGVSAAQAASPTWGFCYKTPHNYGGKYKNAGCTETAAKSSGAYQWAPKQPESISPHLQEMSATSDVVFETPHGVKIECTAISGRAYPLGGTALKTPLWIFEGLQLERRRMPRIQQLRRRNHQ